MHNNIIFLQIKRILRNKFIIIGITFIISVIYLLPNAVRLATIVKGPKKININNITKPEFKDTSRNYYVCIHGEKIYDLNKYYAGFKDLNFNVIGKYYALKKDNKIIIVIVPIDKTPDTTLSGFVYKPDNSEWIEGIKKAAVTHYSDNIDNATDLQNPVVGSCFVNGLIYDDFYLVPIIFFLIIFFASTVTLIVSIIKWIKPDTNKIYENLIIYGVPYKVINEIESDSSKANPIVYGKATLYNNWLINKTFFNAKVVKTNELVWVYKSIIRKGKCNSYKLTLCLSSRHIISIKIKDYYVDELIKELCRRNPWIITDYSAEVNWLWSEDFDQLSTIIKIRKDKLKNNMQL